jgi:replicative DNA helicase
MATKFKLKPIEAELSIIQTLIKVKNLWIYVLDELEPHHFSSDETRELYSSARKSITKSDTCTLASIQAYISKEACGLLKGVDPCLTAKEAKALCGIIIDRYRRRELLETADGMKKRLNTKEAVETIASEAESSIFHITQGTTESRTVEVCTAIKSIEFEPETFITTGYEGVDEHIYGLGEGDMLIMAGRPGSGKSALMMNIADTVSKEVPCVVFSLEMTAKQLQQRLLCAKAKVNLEMALKGKLKAGHKEAIRVAKEWFELSGLIIDDNPILTPESLRLKILHYQRKYGIKAVFIDYIQLMRAPRSLGIYEKTTEISKSIKAIANEFRMPILSGAQLNRKVEDRDDREPRVSDLRDSGSLEQDADCVMLLHRPGLYDNDPSGKTELIIGKNRRGRTGKVPLIFLKDYTLFVES